ncbi:MAG: DUF1836 domain-containing protein [Eubacteriales bacterium]
MNIDTKNIIDSILDNISNIEYLKIEDIPNIPLYMDQVTTLMDEKLKASKRCEDDKILTKTMINNYAKNNLLPPPIKKKYNKEHVLVLVFIYYFKNILSIKDIEKLLQPITSKFFDNAETFNINDLYQDVFNLEKSHIEYLKEELRASYQIAQDTFSDDSNPDQAFLQVFSFICILSLDVYVKKQIIENLIDNFSFDITSEEKKQRDKKSK